MPRLSVFLFGPMRVTLDGDPVTGFDSDKVRALLAYLAVETGAPQRRERLAGLLWPDLPEQSARANLRHVLANLRKVIGDRRAVPPFLHITRQAINFNHSSDTWVDVAVFTNLLQTSQPTNQQTVDQQEQAVGLVRGAFLEGFSLPGCSAFEEWALFEGERLRRLALEALARLSDWHEKQGKVESALDYAWRQVELDPLRESAHRQVMRLLALGDQRGTALAQYETCCRVLAKELGVKPEAETIQLYGQIRDGGLEVSTLRPVPVQESEPVAALPVFLAEDAKEVQPPVFVARERELARLEGLLKTTLAGQGSVILVTGGAGRGKTALLAEFARQAMTAQPDLLVASGNCNAYSGIGDPYLPFREVLGQLTGDVENHWEAGTITRDHALRLWSALPKAAQALLDHGPHITPALLPGGTLLARCTAAGCQSAPWYQRLRERVERQRAHREGLEQSHLFQQVTNLLRALAGVQPLLLILDDLQWADTASVGLLFHLGRQLEGCRILVAGAYRPEETALGRQGKRHPLEKALAEFKRHYGDAWVDLGRVDEAEGRNFVAAFTETESHQLGEGFRRALFKHTQGHPLFTIELLRAMQERGDIVRDEHGRWVERPSLSWEALPARVEAVIEERIGRLEEELREVLSVASVEGEEFTAQVVARVQDIQERRLLRALSQDLEKRHRLVRERAEDQVGRRLLSRYRFAHHLFQKYLYNDLSAGERRLLHGEIAEILEKLFENRTEEIVVQLAFHYRRAEIRDKALSCLVQAGHQAQASFANEEALGYYTEALRMMPEDGADRFDLLAARAAVYRLVARYDEQRADVEEMLALAEALDDDACRCTALMALSLYQEKTGFHFHESYISAQQALQIAEVMVAPLHQARALRRLGNLNWHRDEFHQSREQLKAAVQVFADEGLTGEEAHCWDVLSLTLGNLNETHLALEAAEKSVTLSQQAGDRRQEAISLRRVAIALYTQNRYAEALPFARRALALHREVGDRGEECAANNLIGVILACLGEYGESERYLIQSLELGESSGSSIAIIDAAVNLMGFHYERRGDFQEGLAFLAVRVEKALLKEDDWLVARLRMTEMEILRLLGQHEAAQQVLTLASHTMDRVGYSSDRLFCGIAMSVLQALTGGYQEAMGILQLAAETARETRDEVNLAHALLCQSDCALKEGKPETMRWGLEQIRQALELIPDSNLDQRSACYAIMAGLHLALADIDEALGFSSKGVQLLDSDPALPQPERTLFIHFRVLQALGRHGEADEYLRQAHERVMLVAGKTPDKDLRQSWLENVQFNREILAAWAERRRDE